jgi:5-oxoprolinase (ATP-hydrolysing)/N-methylhydantoinase B
MRFSNNGYYIEKYVKCANCGVLVYGPGTRVAEDKEDRVFCSDWCVEWSALRKDGARDVRLPLRNE